MIQVFIGTITGSTWRYSESLSQSMDVVGLGKMVHNWMISTSANKEYEGYCFKIILDDMIVHYNIVRFNNVKSRRLK